MAMMIFMSSLGYNLDVHYCGGEFFDFSILGNVQSCQDSDGNDSKEKFVNRSCCDLKQFKIETAHSFEKSSSDLTAQTVSFNIPIVSYSLLFKGVSVDYYNKWVLESPPEIKTNKIYIKVESFLI
jgi:hypothetical protein